VTPPADARAPDTLAELNQAGQVISLLGSFGTVTIASKTYEGVSLPVDRSDDRSNTISITTHGRYKRLTGKVGINDNTQCPRTNASVSITDDQGQTLWGPVRASLNSTNAFDISIKGLPVVTLVGRSLATSEDACADGATADPAWGDLAFVK
jgi:hypothetical protein